MCPSEKDRSLPHRSQVTPASEVSCDGCGNVFLARSLTCKCPKCGYAAGRGKGEYTMKVIDDNDLIK